MARGVVLGSVLAACVGVFVYAAMVYDAAKHYHDDLYA